MRTSVRVFSLPKAGNSAAEYEDAHWPRVSGESEGELNVALSWTLLRHSDRTTVRRTVDPVNNYFADIYVY